VANRTRSDYRIRIDSQPRMPTCGCQLVDAPSMPISSWSTTSATAIRALQSSTPIRTVTLEGDAGKPDVTVQLSADAKGADYRLYVHSVRFSAADAGGFARRLWKGDQSRPGRLDRPLRF